jgi:DNA-binding XRE family transcriptional regulator
MKGICEVDINRRIKELRNLIGASQTEFANNLGVPQNCQN